MKMTDATAGFDRLVALRALAERLAGEIDQCTVPRDLAQLSKQYRETMAEIEALDNGEEEENEIASIILRHRKPGADAHGGPH